MFIDTHCHLTDDFPGGPDGVIARANDAGITKIICATADPNAIPRAIEIAMGHDNMFCTIGIHPEYVPIDPDKYLTNDILQHPRVVGIGEIGLDYHNGDDNRNAQIDLFERQLTIARRVKLPVAIHSRDAETDTATLLHDVRGVMHCYTSGWDLAMKMLDRGFFFSASGILTFKNADDVRETFRRIPIDRIVIETDAPWCAPVPFRGRQCEPAMMIETARVLANIKNIDIDDLARQLEQNTKNLYPKISDC